MKRTTFIYCLTEPGTKVIRYFGKADDPRDRRANHVRAARRGEKGRKENWIRKLIKRGQRPDMHVLCEVPSDDWERFESAFIALGRQYGLRLTNATDGGEGGSGYKHTPEALADFCSRKHSEETLAKMRGRKKSEEERAKLRVKRSEETRLKHTLGQFGKKKQCNTSGFVGITKRPLTGKWQSAFGYKKKKYYIGVFSKIEDAVFARNLTIANFK